MKPFFVILQIHGVNEDFSALQLGLPDDARYDNTQLEPVLERFGMYHEWNQLQQLNYPMPVEHLMYLMVEAGLVKRLKTSRMRGSAMMLD